MAIVLEVARSAAENDAGNAVDVRDIVVQKIDLYLRNETLSREMQGKCTDDDRAISPLDVDVVRLFAVVWAKPKGDKGDFLPYCGDGFKNNDLLFETGRRFGPGMGQNRKAGFGEKPNANPNFKLNLMWRARLGPDVPELLPWPWTDRVPTFTWQELIIKTTHKNSPSTRTYKYKAPVNLELPEDADGWTYIVPVDSETGRLPAGTRRFRVRVALPEGVVTRSGKRKATLASSSADGTGGSRKKFKKGFSLRLSVRRFDAPRFSPADDARGVGPRSQELADMLLWSTAFLNTPYENGGMWFGGREAEDQPQSGSASSGYQGCGIDCNGFINTAAFLGGVQWPDVLIPTHRESKCGLEHPHEGGHRIVKPWPKNWYRVTLSKGGSNPYLRFPGVEITADELRPGDLLDQVGHSHVRLVWQVWDDPDKGRMVSWIESAGSANRVRLKAEGSTAAALAANFRFINMNDPQSRHAESDSH